MPDIAITVNGTRHELPGIEPSTPLLWVLRETLGLVGTKYGCGVAQCGACTVHVNGKPTRSCFVSVSTVHNAEITTIEGLAQGNNLHPLQEAWIDLDVPQCGFCQSGQLMSAAALLRDKPNPTDEDIDRAMGGNLCRCMTYRRIKAAIHLAAERTGNGESS